MMGESVGCWLLATASLVTLGVSSAINAQAANTYPSRPIRMVISNGPGSAGDMLGRIAFIREDYERYGRVVKQAGVRAE